MKILELLAESTAPSSWATEEYGNWLITSSTYPNSQNKYQAVAKHAHLKDRFLRADGETQQSAIDAVKSVIMSQVPRSSVQSKQLTINLNVPFTTAVLSSSNEPHYFMITVVDGTPFLVMANDVWKNYQSDLLNSGFSRANPRLAKDVTELGAKQAWAFPLSKKSSASINLVPNGRYVLGPPRANNDDNTMWPMIFDSVTTSPSDKYHIKKPALTVIAARSDLSVAQSKK